MLDSETGANSIDDPAPWSEPVGVVGTILIIALSILVAHMGGYLCGMAISQWGTTGSLVLWPLGALAGWIGRKLSPTPRLSNAIVLVVGTVLAFLIAEVCWLHWNTKQGAASWLEAVRWLPTFFVEYQVPALIAGFFTAMGALSCYRQTAPAR